MVPDGAAAVVLQVTATSNAPAKLVGWSSGAPRPAGQAAMPIGTTTTTIAIPLASDGTVGLGTTLGAANVVAKVIEESCRTPRPRRPHRLPPRPPPAPSRPRSVKARSARTNVKTSWRKPARMGGSAVTGYRVEALVSKRKGARVAGTCTAAPSARSCMIMGLTKGRTYWMSVFMSNSAGSTWAPRKKVRVR